MSCELIALCSAVEAWGPTLGEHAEHDAGAGKWPGDELGDPLVVRLGGQVTSGDRAFGVAGQAKNRLDGGDAGDGGIGGEAGELVAHGLVAVGAFGR